MILRVVGAFLVINAIAYAVQFVFNDLYQDGQGLEPKHIWQVIDYVAVVVILAALAVNFMSEASLAATQRRRGNQRRTSGRVHIVLCDGGADIVVFPQLDRPADTD